MHGQSLKHKDKRAKNLVQNNLEPVEKDVIKTDAYAATQKQRHLQVPTARPALTFKSNMRDGNKGTKVKGWDVLE